MTAGCGRIATASDCATIGRTTVNGIRVSGRSTVLALPAAALLQIQKTFCGPYAVRLQTATIIAILLAGLSITTPQGRVCRRRIPILSAGAAALSASVLERVENGRRGRSERSPAS